MQIPHSSAPTAPPLPPELPIQPVGHPIDLDIAVPGSKSITNRYLVISALADGEVNLTGMLHSDDTHYMVEGLKSLGFSVDADWNAKSCRVRGENGRIPKAGAELYVGASGTTMRFLSAFVALGSGRFRLDGTARMRQRPIEDLLSGMRLMGVSARSETGNGCPPVLVEAAGLPGGRTKIDGSRSSQYISAMLLVAPYAKAPLELEVTGEFVSKPFVELTLKNMSDFGVLTTTEGERLYRPTHGARYRAGTYDVEGDATAASYFLAAAAILGGRCCVTNVAANSAQGDAAFIDVLRRMGCTIRKGMLANGRGLEVSRDSKVPLKAIDADMNDMPDVAQTLAAVCMFADGKSTIQNVGNLRIKETDRLTAVANELRRMGAEIEEGEDYLEITPRAARAAKIETYDDHRMAMAMALVGLVHPGIVIKDPACVSKTYPNYFDDLKRLH
ncbi:MAG TPA: 3-phosphoshikimate 1-carboxyvinyltransferase [Planctomycetota bacterium]|nr:3-phosphoshikimate 1-carboxyvinyltransferase [Planctomycetota bacterium]